MFWLVNVPHQGASNEYHNIFFDGEKEKYEKVTTSYLDLWWSESYFIV